MKSIVPITLSIASAISLSNCAAPAGPNTQRGVATGALLGAAIGAAAGGTAGGLYGNARDQEQYGRRY